VSSATVPVPGAAACANHPRREAIGICVACRKQVCGECTTKVDGINYCVHCLGTLAGPARREATGDGPTSPVLAALSLVGGVALLTVLAWATIELGSMW
jgi:alkyl hydroperoxide reductase subunit AhpF